MSGSEEEPCSFSFFREEEKVEEERRLREDKEIRRAVGEVRRRRRKSSLLFLFSLSNIDVSPDGIENLSCAFIQLQKSRKTLSYPSACECDASLTAKKLDAA